MSASVVPPRKPVALLMGPTGAGKTDLAIRLADRFPIEIISVDSAMVYRGLNIGTGKPDGETLQRYPHHLVDILDPSEAYSAGRFAREARQLIDIAHRAQRLPLLVGGTMLYFRALRYGLAELPVADSCVRQAIDQQARDIGWPAMHAELMSIDPRAAARIQPNDGQRIQRALEVFRVSGKTLSAFHAETPVQPTDVTFAAHAWVPSDRVRLHASIERRFHTMVRSGLLDEVSILYKRGDLHTDLPSIRSVGYRQLWQHLDGKITLDEAILSAIVATRQLARRQLVWLRSERDVSWIDSLELESNARMDSFIAALCAEVE